MNFKIEPALFPNSKRPPNSKNTNKQQQKNNNISNLINIKTQHTFPIAFIRTTKFPQTLSTNFNTKLIFTFNKRLQYIKSHIKTQPTFSNTFIHTTKFQHTPSMNFKTQPIFIFNKSERFELTH